VIATDPAVHPSLQRLLDGQIALNLDAASAIFGVSPHFTLDGDLVEYIASILGAVAVLSQDRSGAGAGSKQLEHLALPTAADAAQPGRPARERNLRDFNCQTA